MRGKPAREIGANFALGRLWIGARDPPRQIQLPLDLLRRYDGIGDTGMGAKGLLDFLRIDAIAPDF